MKKILTVMSLGLLVAAAAFAGVGEDRLFVQPNATFSPTSVSTGGSGMYEFASTSGPSTTNNDDSCDISVMPAATLLIPYFEVDLDNRGRDTLFSITNTTEQPQIAHVTIWTDWSYPVIDFNLWLTGYDVVPVSLYNVIALGEIPVTGYDESNIGDYSVDDGGGGVNPNFNDGAVTADPGCATLPGNIPGTLRDRVQSALTTGVYTTACDAVGGTNDLAVGYITIDVANQCSQLLPDNPLFYASDILWDNTLIGEYYLIDRTAGAGTGLFAGGNPMVHIRAIPEGGPVANAHLGTPAFGGALDPVINRAAAAAAGAAGSNFPFTFYDRYTTVENIDRRQPLPSRFAARFIEDAEGAVTGFSTNIIIWREGGLTSGASGVDCDLVEDQNSANPPTAVVRFDESENPAAAEICQVSPCDIPEFTTSYEETQSLASDDLDYFPEGFADTEDLGGWFYLDLNGFATDSDLEADAVRLARNEDAQAWVAIQMFAEGDYSAFFDAAMLENGCTPGVAAPGASTEADIRPGPNVVP